MEIIELQEENESFLALLKVIDKRIDLTPELENDSFSSLLAVEQALLHNKKIFLATQRNAKVDNPQADDINTFAGARSSASTTLGRAAPEAG